jgi:signal transduction histidine kinase/ligand-binding sensor domain-containing protein
VPRHRLQRKCRSEVIVDSYGNSRPGGIVNFNEAHELRFLTDHARRINQEDKPLPPEQGIRYVSTVFAHSPTAALSTGSGRLLPVLVVSSVMACVMALEAGAAVTFSLRRWQTEEGLPQNSVTCLLQSREGYLWFGTYGGLVRFDGVRFSVFDSDRFPGLADSRVTALFEDARGTLWIGHETGNVTRLEGGELEPVALVVQLRRSEIVDIAADRAGEVWMLNREGWVVRLNDGPILDPPPLLGTEYGGYGFALSPEGVLWCLRSGRLEEIRGGAVHQWTPPIESTQSGRGVQAICAARAGGIWISQAGRIRRFGEGQWLEEPAEQPWRFKAVGCLTELAGGGLAVGTEQSGLYLSDGAGRVDYFSRTNGLARDWVRSLCQDREGTLWVGLGSGGLTAIHAVSFERVNPPDQWDGRAVLSLETGRDGVLWVGTEGAGIYSWQNGAWSRYTTTEGDAVIGYVWSVAETRTGRLLVGTWSAGLFVFDQGRFLPAPGAELLPPRPITALLAGAGEAMWIGTADGVGRYEAGRLTWLPEQDGVRVADVRCLARDAEEALWIGMYGGGLAHYHAGRFRVFKKDDGLGSDCISCLHFDAQGALWIGTTGGGLARYHAGRFSRIGSKHGLPSVNISAIEEDTLGGVWLGSSAGVLQVRKAALEDCAEGRASNVVVRAYGLGDGLDTTECSSGFQPASCQTADGCLWFPTRRGLVRVNPAVLVTNSLPPPVRIESLRVQDEEIPLPPAAGAGLLSIPPGRERFELQFTALSFVAPEKVRFKYRLLGLERDWVERSQRSAAYSHLQPGDYVFQVVACNNDDVWNETGAKLAFTVLPYFWQTWWFRLMLYAATGVAVAGGVVWETRRRLHRKLERLERQRTVERERTRIAQDIHDDLGASLTRITMLSQTARKELENPAAVGQHLTRIEGTARELTRAMDETVWAINPRHDTLDSLAGYLVRFAQDFLGPAGIRCRVDVPLALPGWPLGAELRHNVFLAFKEAINNVVRHANAREVRISMHPREDGFDLWVEDDGQGIDPSRVPSAGSAQPGRPVGGNGLRNMHARLNDLGGAVSIRSDPGSGTTVSFRIPVQHRNPA